VLSAQYVLSTLFTKETFMLLNNDLVKSSAIEAMSRVFCAVYSANVASQTNTLSIDRGLDAADRFLSLLKRSDLTVGE